MSSYALITTCFLLALSQATRAPAEADPAPPVRYAHPEMRHMDFLVGEWDFHATYRTPTGEGQATYRSRVSYTLDGKALLDTFCSVLPDGRVEAQGSTVRTYDVASGKWRMVFYGANLDYVTEFEGRLEDGEFRFDGRGHQGERRYLERVTFYDIEADRYAWTMDRSYDGGETWIEELFRYDAVRVRPAGEGEARQPAIPR